MADELDSLIKSLEREPDKVATIRGPKSPKPAKSPELPESTKQPKPSELLEPLESLTGVIERHVDEYDVSNNRIQEVVAIQSNTNDPNNAVREMLEQTKDEFNKLNHEVLTNWRDDREKNKEVIDHLIADMRNHELSVPGATALVKALDVQTNSTMIPIKLMEVKTKLLAALKNGIVVNNNNNNIGSVDQDLIAVLDAPISDDLE